MATASARAPIKDNVLAVTVVLTAVGYALVAATFGGLLPYPTLSVTVTDLMSHAIAVVNTLALACFLAGWYWIRRGEVGKHRAAMASAFTLILVFLLLYLPRVGGGGERHFVLEASYAWVPTWWVVEPLYLVMLAVHILLSALAMPVVLYAFLLGVTHSPAELRETRHARVGRIAAAAWSLSLALGVFTYLLLNHLYASEFVPA